jgi:hypothetical protein
MCSEYSTVRLVRMKYSHIVIYPMCSEYYSVRLSAYEIQCSDLSYVQWVSPSQTSSYIGNIVTWWFLLCAVRISQSDLCSQTKFVWNIVWWFILVPMEYDTVVIYPIYYQPRAQALSTTLLAARRLMYYFVRPYQTSDSCYFILEWFTWTRANRSVK